jgi:hypothetical protein
MAKKQNVKKSLPKKSDGLNFFWNKHWQVILIVVLAFGILGFIGVNKLIIYNQKQQFDQAEKSLDTLYTNIVKDVGQPTSMNKDDFCSYRSVEFGQGDRNCSVGIYAYFSDITNKESALLIAKKTESALNQISNIEILRNLTQNDDKYVSPGNYSSSSDFKFKDQNLECYISYTLNKSGSRSSSSSFGMGLSCYGPAKDEFYPVKN